jgi:hypothetical protein
LDTVKKSVPVGVGGDGLLNSAAVSSIHFLASRFVTNPRLLAMILFPSYRIALYLIPAFALYSVIAIGIHQGRNNLLRDKACGSRIPSSGREEVGPRPPMLPPCADIHAQDLAHLRQVRNFDHGQNLLRGDGARRLEHGNNVFDKKPDVRLANFRPLTICEKSGQINSAHR